MAYSIGQLIRALEDIPRTPYTTNPSTGGYGAIDEAVLKLSDKHPSLNSPRQAFSIACGKLWPHSLNKRTWKEFQDAAKKLANALKAIQ